MNEVIKNTHAFVDVLSMARGEAVQTWDEGTFQRAFKWAQYFEEVYIKLKCKPLLAEKLNKYIGNFNKTGTLYLGNLQLSFSKLEKSKDILRNCLLQNPHLSNSQLEHVLRLYGVKLGTWNDPKNVKALEQDIVDIAKQKGTLTIVSQIRDKFTEKIHAEINGSNGSNHINEKMRKQAYQDMCVGVSTSKIALNSGGQLLFKYILHFLESSESKDIRAMHEKLRIISVQEDGIEIISSCLLFIPDDCQSNSKAESVQQFIINWLLESLSSETDHTFWSLPPTVLSSISFIYESILNLYLSRLTSWANNMSAVLTCLLSIKEKKTLQKSKVYFWRSQEPFCSNSTTKKSEDDTCDLLYRSANALDLLTLHFKSLTKGPIHIQELCFKIIERQFSDCSKTNMEQQSRTNTVHFSKLDVNIWWDLYCELKNS